MDLNQDHFLSNKMYSQLKFLAQILLPALGTLYFTLSGIWGLPAAEEVVGTIVAVDAFLGVLLSISTSSYNQSGAKFDGAVHLGEIDGDERSFHLELPISAADIENADQLVLKVNHPT